MVVPLGAVLPLPKCLVWQQLSLWMAVGLPVQISHLCGLCRNFCRAFDPERRGLGEGLGWAQSPCQAHLTQEPPWSCSSPSNKCLVNTFSTLSGQLLIILSPLLITWHGFTPRPSFLKNSTQSPPSVSLSHPPQWWPLTVFYVCWFSCNK